MKKEIEGKSEASVPKLEDLLNGINKEIDVRETKKGTILGKGNTYFMHVRQSKKGVHRFFRTKTGKHLQSGYMTNKDYLDTLIREINETMRDYKLLKESGHKEYNTETRKVFPPPNGKNEKAKA